MQMSLWPITVCWTERPTTFLFLFFSWCLSAVSPILALTFQCETAWSFKWKGAHILYKEHTTGKLLNLIAEFQVKTYGMQKRSYFVHKKHNMNRSCTVKLAENCLFLSFVFFFIFKISICRFTLTKLLNTYIWARVFFAQSEESGFDGSFKPKFMSAQGLQNPYSSAPPLFKILRFVPPLFPFQTTVETQRTACTPHTPHPHFFPPGQQLRRRADAKLKVNFRHHFMAEQQPCTQFMNLIFHFL